MVTALIKLIFMGSMRCPHAHARSRRRQPHDGPEGPRGLATAPAVAHDPGRAARAPQDTTFLAATAKGLGVTLKHFARNLFLPLRSAKARAKAGAPVDEQLAATRSRPSSTPRRRSRTRSASAACTA